MDRKFFYFAAALSFALIGATVSASAQNYKIKQTISMNGQNMTNTTYVRGPRKRTETSGIMGMGGDVANIEQCDLKQYVRVNDKKKLYVVEPFDSGDVAATARSTTPKAKTTRGGTVTYTSNINDTGERKQMFGMTARHLKTTTTMESSPDACSKSNMNIQTDGWYIDLPEFSCPINLRSMSQYQAPQGGCQDRMIMKNTGAGKLGFPLSETRTMSMEGTSFSQTTETIEFTKSLLDAFLFDVPTGYTAASDAQALYGRPDYSAMMKSSSDDDNTGLSSTAGMAKTSSADVATFSGTKIGVMVPTNRGEPVSVGSLQSMLVQRLSGSNVMAVPVSSEADARAKNLDYLLMSDITKLKQSTAGKIGGLFGKVAGTPTAGAYDAQVEYKLMKLADGKVTFQSKSSAKSETEVNAAAENILGMEAASVLGAIR